MKSVDYSNIVEACDIVRKKLPITPLTHSPEFSRLVGHDVYLKWDSKLRMGSFKERGAINVISHLNQQQKQRGICAASLGNHALAVGRHASQFKVPCKIVMPVNAPLVKIQRTRATGVEVILFGSTLAEATEHAKELARHESRLYISPYDNEYVIAGQGTCGIEICDQLSDFDSIVVPVGGGGYISGIALALRKRIGKKVFILGAQSEWAVNHHKNKNKNESALFSPITIADGIAVKGIGEITGPIINQNVDALATVSELQIASAVIAFLEHERSLVEGSGAAGLAAVLEGKLPKHLKKTVIVVSGGNIDISILARIIERDMHERGNLIRIEVSVPDRPGAFHTVTGLIASKGVNIRELHTSASFSHIPGYIDMTISLDVIDGEHRKEILQALNDAGLNVNLLD